MLFSDVLAPATIRNGVWSVSVGEDWLQGRSLFGGMQSALALRAMRRLVAPEVPSALYIKPSPLIHSFECFGENRNTHSRGRCPRLVGCSRQHPLLPRGKHQLARSNHVL